jgi:molecular chaperone HtpG
MTTRTTPASETFEYKAEMKQLLHLIIHSLYTHKEIFLRELISNASDALNRIHVRMLTDRDVVQADVERRIDIRGDKNENTLTLTDTGIGMTREDLVDRLGTVASSGTEAFMRELQESGKTLDAQMIGQFGVGFYSAFMVSDRITLETRGPELDGQGYRWESDGGGQYSIEEIDREERGTTITLHLNEDSSEYAEEWRLKAVIRKYSNFVDAPIYVDGEQVNTVKALWHKSKSELEDGELSEFYKFIANDYSDPLGHLHLHIEGRVNFDALLFLPAKAPRGLYREDYEYGLHLYSSNIFIQDDCKLLLPEYLRFVRGVVDTEDLPLNVSREVTQNSPVMAKIQQILTGKILGMLKEWSLDDKEKYDLFVSEFGPLFKTGLSSDFSNRDDIIELVRYESTSTAAGESTSLAQYVDRMQPEQKEIYYLLGNDRQIVEKNPNLEYFNGNDLEVLLMLDPVDVFTITSIPRYKEHDLKSIEKADLDLEKKKKKRKKGQVALGKHQQKKILERIKSVIGDRVEDVVVSKRLVDSAATLVVGKTGMDAQTERMMRLMDENFSGSKKVLEINTDHPLIRNLSRLREDGEQADLVRDTIEQLFEGALLVDGSLATPADFVTRMTRLMVEATGSGVEQEADSGNGSE